MHRRLRAPAERRHRRSADARSGAGPARVAVVFPDLTRPMPNRTVLPPLLAELERLGAGPTGWSCCAPRAPTARPPRRRWSSSSGPTSPAGTAIHQHRADDGDHVEVGRVDGTPVRIDRRYVEADVRILTGFVEPHFFAGFSGGPEGRVPGPGRHWRRSSKPTARPGSPTLGPPGSSPRAIPSTTSSGPRWPWRRRRCLSTWPSTAPPADRACSPGHCRPGTARRAGSSSETSVQTCRRAASTSSSAPTAAIRSTATCTRR